MWTRKGQEATLCDAENVLYLDMSGGYTGIYIKLHSVCTRTFKFSVLYVPAVRYISKKCLFPCLATTLIKPAGLLVPCCSDQEVTSLNDTDVCMSLFLFLLLSHCLSSLPFAPRAMIFVFSRFLLAQVTALPGTPLLATLSSCCLSCLGSRFWSPFPCLVGSLPCNWPSITSAVTVPFQVTGHLLIRQRSCHQGSSPTWSLG